MPVSALAADLPGLLDLLAAAWTAIVKPRPQIAVEVAEGPDALAQTFEAWSEVERADNVGGPFQSLAVAQVAARAHEHRGETLRIVVVREAGRPVVVLPGVVGGWNGLPVLRFLGDPFIQYGDVAAATDAKPEHIEAAWSAAADPRSVAFVHLRKVRSDARLAPLLAARTRPLQVQEAPYLDLRAPCPASRARKRELARLRRRLREQGAVALELTEGAAARPAIAEALTLKREWLRERGFASKVIGDDAWERALAELAGSGILRAARLTVGGETAAVELALVRNGRWCAFLGAMAPRFARSGPGQVQMEDTIALCREEGLARYDLLAPADPYKRRICKDSVEVVDYGAALNSAGTLALAATRAVPHLKTLLERLPANMRRTLVGGLRLF